jgi:hypothetical protein
MKPAQYMTQISLYMLFLASVISHRFAACSCISRIGANQFPSIGWQIISLISSVMTNMAVHSSSIRRAIKMKVFQVAYYDSENDIASANIYTQKDFVEAGGIVGIFEYYTKRNLVIIDFGWI